MQVQVIRLPVGSRPFSFSILEVDYFFFWCFILVAFAIIFETIFFIVPSEYSLSDAPNHPHFFYYFFLFLFPFDLPPIFFSVISIDTFILSPSDFLYISPLVDIPCSAAQIGYKI